LLRVLGIPINIKKIIEKDKAVQSGENENKKEGTKDRKPHLEHMDTVEDSKTESGESKKSLTEDSITKESITKRITGEHRKKEDKNKQKHDKNSFKKRIKNILRKICNIIRKIKEYIYLKFFDIKDMYDKVAEFNKFIKSKTTKEAYRFAKRIIIKLIKHIFPSKIKGNLHFGFDEPDKTGKTLGYIAMIFQVFNVNIKKIKIEPDFDKKIFEGNVSVKGHFVIGLVLIYVLRLYFKREIRLVVKIKLRQK
jgi:hypothetical protein